MQKEEVKQKIEQTITKEQIYYNEPMKKHTSFKTGGPAEIFIKIKKEEEIKQMQKIAKEKNIPITILGNGTNILVEDKGIEGIVAKIDIKKISIEETKEGKIIVTTGAGNTLTEVAQILAKEEITGFEELSGIPGTIGGAIKMNAGAHGKEIKDVIKQAKILKGTEEIKVLKKEELGLSYRKSIFSKEKAIILEAQFILQKGKKEQIKEKMKNYLEMRKEKQPLEYPSAGSTFKRGENYITAKLIDEAGLKGYQIGGAQISEKHAGFIINKENATSKDIKELIQYTQEKIYEKFNINIQLEIEILGGE